MARFEAEIHYDRVHAEVLETYADSMGWRVDYPDGPFATFVGEGPDEDDLLRDVEQHIRFFSGEEPPALPLSFRIVRVIYDSVTGYDEITTTRDWEMCPDNLHRKDIGAPCGECASAGAERP